MSSRPALRDLAEYCGIVSGFVDWRGDYRETTDAAREALLVAMRLDADSEEGAGRALEELRASEASAAGVAILRPGEHVIEAAAPAIATVSEELSGELTLRDMRMKSVVGHTPVRSANGRLRITVPENMLPEPGYYDAEFRIDGEPEGRTHRWFVLAPPAACVSVGQRSGRDRAFGVMVNLYSVRSPENWGIGDLGDVARVSQRLASMGAGFVGLSPLHATANRGSGISPYYPTSRLFFNWIYLDVDRVPEMQSSREARDVVGTVVFRAALDRCRAGDRVNHGEIGALKKKVLRILYRAFCDLSPDSARQRTYAEYRRRKGDYLDAHAIYEALAEHLAPDGPEEPDWRKWPVEYRARTSRATGDFALAHAADVDFHRWLQFELDRQLAEADGGLSLGLFCDLAVGTAPGGSEVWGHPGVFAKGVALGAPPDDYSDAGQSWGVAPMLPRQLRATRYRHFRQMLTANFRHAGALRVDHAMGLVRQFWVPDGNSAAAGAYVAFPADEMFAVLAIESARAGTIVVAEDLGTVPSGFREDLARLGCLRTQVLYFERDASGEFRPSQAYDHSALATVNTHDLPPLRGYWSGIDLRLRDAAGALDRGTGLADAFARREQEKAALVRRLQADGGLGSDLSAVSLCRAGAVMLARSHAALVAVSLDDLGNEEVPVNVPGLVAPELPLWSRRMGRDVCETLAEPAVVETVRDAVALMDPSSRKD